MENVDRNLTPVVEPKPKSKKSQEDELWSKFHGPSRVKVDDMSVDRILEEQIAEVWQYGEE